LLLAAFTVSGSPATTIALVKEARARGVFVKTLVGGVALNNMSSIALFAIAHVATRVALDPTAEHSFIDYLLAPVRAISLSAVLGLSSGAALVFATRRIVRPERLATASIVTILVTCGLALQLGFSPLLAALFVGVATANLSPEKEELGVLALADFEVAILAVFFTLAGMQLHVGHLVPAAGVVFLVFAIRFAGKILAGGLAMSLAGATSKMRRYLGLALLPQAGVAVGLIVLVQEDPALAEVRDFFLTVGLGVVTLNEIIGPLATKLALERSGEAGKDRPRLIDFIREEHIITDLQANTKDEAIATLTDWLIETHGLNVDRERLLGSVRTREAEMSTCVGNGLAVPHGELDEGDLMVGVMGLSRVGLPFDTPDGRPVHCIVLLATPASQRDRHLEVLASLMRAIGADPNIQWQLYNAKSSAHAYELLHTEQAEDFNYFLN
jgi:mannitol/fructose-specific phosphotransferase system IIA component (Ntr-type)